MKKSFCIFGGLASAILLLGTTTPVLAQNTAFTYQGRLNAGSAPASGLFDLRFGLYDAASSGIQQGNLLTNTATPVSNGLFTVTVDFGDQFPGADRWLEIAVRTNDNVAFSLLSPRQRVAATPYAIHATTAASLNGGVTLAQLPAGVVTNGSSSVNVSGSFIGNGGGLTNVNATTLNGAPVSSFWQLGGNAVTGGQFLGTTNLQPLQLFVGGRRAVRLEPGVPEWGTVNVVGGSPANTVGIALGGVTIAGGGATNYLGITRAWANTANDNFVTIGGGAGNQGEGLAATIGGGINNSTAGGYSVIGGGSENSNGVSYGFIGGGAGNTNTGNYGVISGGALNRTTGSSAVVGGGEGNLAAGRDSTVAGGAGNSAIAPGSTVGGGGYNGTTWAANQALGPASTIGGGYGNTTVAEGATVSGGLFNSSGFRSVVGGGYQNTATGSVVSATIAGGGLNKVTSDFGAIGGGYANTNTGSSATIAGGNQNRSPGGESAVGGGILNLASGARSAIGGGSLNTASGMNAAIPGGQYNIAAGTNSLAAGQNAQALHSGSFVWADSQGTAFPSATNDQFLIRAKSGVGINTTNTTAVLTLGGTGGVDGIRFPDGTLQTTAPSTPPMVFVSGAATAPTATINFLSAIGTITLSRTARIMITSHCALGSSAAGGASLLNIYIGYRPVSGTITTLGGGIFGLTAPQGQRLTYGLSAITGDLPPGTYEVGLVGSSSAAANWNNNEWSYTTAVAF